MSTPDVGMIDWMDAQLDEMFLRSEVRPLDGFLNAGEHRVDISDPSAARRARVRILTRELT